MRQDSIGEKEAKDYLIEFIKIVNSSAIGKCQLNVFYMIMSIVTVCTSYGYATLDLN